MSTLKYFSCILLFFLQPISAQNFWQPSEFPSQYSGEIIAIAIKENIAIASSYQDGLAISTNLGQNWSSTFPTENFQPYSSLAILSSGQLFALGYDGYLYVSNSNGANWTISTNINFFNNPHITVDQQDNIYIGCAQGVYRSTDLGKTWSLQNAGLSIGGSSPFVNIAISSNGILAASTPSGVFKSTNSANTWSMIRAIGAGNIGVNSLGYVYAAKYRENPYLYVDSLYRTTNNGVSWEPLKKWEGLLIFINPTNDAIVLADYDYYNNYFLSTNYGSTWTTINTDRSPVEISYNGNGNYLMGTDGKGLFKSNSLSADWQACNTGFPGTVTKVTTIVSNYNKIFAGTNSFGLFISTNDGNSFSSVSTELNNLNVGKLAITTNGYMFAMAIQGTILRSTNLGETWSYYLGQGVLYDLATNCLCTNGNIVLTGGTTDYAKAELDKSTDSGTTWEEVFSIPGSTYSTEYKIIALGIDGEGLTLGCVEKRQNINPPMPTWIYSYAIIRSSDYGSNWNTSTYNFDRINDFVWNSLGEIYAITSEGLLKSTDDGLTWNNTSGNLPTNNLKSITIDFRDNIYIGTGNMGVIYSSDNGYNWIILNDGITDSVIHSLCISYSGYLFAGTEHGGIFRSKDTVNPAINIPNLVPNEFALSQNYPNPFNPSTKIKFQIPDQVRNDNRFVTLKVYDVLGNEIATLVNEEKQPGTYEVEFDVNSDEGRNLSSGVYFYQLRIGGPEINSPQGQAGQGFIETKKMVLLR